MGKTNLEDAIYYLCVCKSNFSGSDKNVVKYGEDFFRLEGLFLRNDKKEKITAKIIAGKQKVFEKNDVLYPKLSDHIGYLPIVMIAPRDASLVLEGSEERRKFLDNTLSQSNTRYLKALWIYNKILKQRNAALKEFAKTKSYNYSLIESYDHQMVEPATLIFQKRKAFVKEILPFFSDYYKLISADREKVACEYKSQLSSKPLIDLQKESLEKDTILARTTAGIHRDDLIFKIDNFPIKQFASQGQTKSFLLALKLAQYQYLENIKGIKPILLLDDIFDKLDSHRVRQLLSLLFNKGFGQIFLTDTDENRLEEIIKPFNLDYKKFVISDGKVVID